MLPITSPASPFSYINPKPDSLLPTPPTFHPSTLPPGPPCMNPLPQCIITARADLRSPHAHTQVKRWSMQRARLEEEIIRRQEASRFASPSVHYGSGGGAARVDGGYMSPYRHVISDQVRPLHVPVPT